MADAPRTFLFVLGSARRGGNTETLARAAAKTFFDPATETPGIRY